MREPWKNRENELDLFGENRVEQWKNRERIVEKFLFLLKLGFKSEDYRWDFTAGLGDRLCTKTMAFIGSRAPLRRFRSDMTDISFVLELSLHPIILLYCVLISKIKFWRTNTKFNVQKYFYIFRSVSRFNLGGGRYVGQFITEKKNVYGVHILVLDEPLAE